MLAGLKNSMKKIWTQSPEINKGGRMHKLNFVLFVLLIALICVVYVDINAKYSDLYAQLQAESSERKQNESAIDKDLRLLKTDTDILLYSYKEE